MEMDDLKKVLMYHVVKGEIIFTDGKKAEGFYETNRVDESSTIYNTVYSTIHIRPGIDLIDILDKNGNVVHTVHEEEGKTNIMAAENIAGDDDIDNYVVTSVIHQVDQVLEY